MGVYAAQRPVGVPPATGPTTILDPAGKLLVAECLDGNAAARARFQEQLGPLIYRFAEYANRGSPNTEPGDFYVYLFESDRLYRRLQSYEGRASLGPFLRGFALPDLFKQFLVMTKRARLDTVSIETDCEREPVDPSSLAGAEQSEHDGDDVSSERPNLLTHLGPEKRLLVKLLYIEDFDLGPADLQLLAQRSGRVIREVIERVERARASVREREAERQRRHDEAESAAQWILQYERRLAVTVESLANVPPRSAQAQRLREEHAELERKRAWRTRQREHALAESKRATVTLRYREIAELLNAPIGSVSAQVTRLRQELLTLAAQQASGKTAMDGREPESGVRMRVAND